MHRDPTRLTMIDSAQSWDDFVARENGHVLQSYGWGELKSRFGWTAERFAWVEGDEIRSGAQVLYRRLMPGLEIAYVPRGPISPTPFFLSALEDSMRKRGMFLLKLEPDWQRSVEGDKLLAEAGFHPSQETIQPPATIRIDLKRSPEAILAGMKPKWRYNIRLSEKKGVTIRAGTDKDLPAFFELTRVTATRDRFSVHPLGYYRKAFELLSVGGGARIFVAEFQGRAVAMIFVTAFGHEAIYLYGASGNENRNVMPNHGLQWAAIQWAKARGCEWYDLWGIPVDSVNEAASEETGRVGAPEAAPLPDSLYQFKRGFGGQVVHYTGAWDAIYSSPKYRLYLFARILRRKGIG